MKKITLTFFLIITSSFSQVIESNNINSELKGIVLATYFSKKDATNLANKFKSKDIFIKETIKNNKKYFVVFMLNIKKENQYELLKDVKKIVSSAYITSDSRIKQLSKLSSNHIFKYNSNQLYTKAYNLYKQKDYKKAIDIFNILFEKYPSSTNINFYLGKSLYELKMYDKAIAAFTRLEILNENNLRVNLELAQSYLMLGLYDDAIKNFNFVLKHKIPVAVKKNILKRVAYIKSLEKKYSLNYMIKFGYSYDNNINNTTNVKTFNTPDYQNLLITDKKYLDNSFLIQANANYNYKLSDNKNITSNLNYTQQFYYKDKDRLNSKDENASNINKEDEKNIQIISLDTGLSNIYKNSRYSFLVNLTSIKLASKDYMNVFGGMFSYEKKYLSDIKFLAFTNLSNKKYKQLDYKQQDLYSIKFGVGETIPTENLGLFNSLYIYEREIKEKHTIDNTDKRIQNVLLSNKYNLTPILYLNTSYNFTLTSELDDDPTFKIKRTDKTSIYSFGVGYYLNSNIDIYTNIDNIKNKSTIPIYGYRKFKFNSAISYNF